MGRNNVVLLVLLVLLVVIVLPSQGANVAITGISLGVVLALVFFIFALSQLGMSSPVTAVMVALVIVFSGLFLLGRAGVAKGRICNRDTTACFNIGQNVPAFSSKK